MRFVGRAAAVAEAHESFTWQAVGEAGCRATDVAAFLGCRPPKCGTLALRKGNEVNQISQA